MDQYEEGDSQSMRPPPLATYTALVRDIGKSAKDLFQGDIDLVKAEVKVSLQHVASHSRQVVMFGLIMMLSLPPFMAFLVLGLGELLDGQYWLSALIVSSIFALVGGPLAYRAFTKIRNEDLTFERTRHTLDQEHEILKDKLSKIAATIKGDRYATDRSF